MPLEKQSDNTYKWILEPGKEYYIGLHHGNGLGMFGEDVHAIFLGVIKGYNVFARREDGKIHTYSGDPKAPAMWHCENDDIGSPAVQVRYDGILRKPEMKEFVEKRLEELISDTETS